MLGRLLVLGVAQPAPDVAAALPTCGVDGLRRLGLASVAAGRVSTAALIRPQSFQDDAVEGEWWVASDLDEMALGGPLAEDHVLGVCEGVE
ncbi:MAG TPA: SAM-dependent methyltransferase, partial [Microbacterium sp.]|nr:SAM-dependent methyltransferase [Microbacterium sp.]